MKNYGFIRPLIDKTHYLGGTLPKDILQSNGQWLELLPVNEKQARDNFETYGCTTFGSLNALEILKKRVTNIEDNYSDRFTYITSQTQPPGNDPHIVAETIRKTGVISEQSLPFSDEINTFEKFDNIGTSPENFAREADEWLGKYHYLHEWVFDGDVPNKQELLKEYLQYSPLGVSVYAWVQDSDGLYKKYGEDNHWTCLVGYVENEYWIVFDSYPTTDGSEIKHLAWNFDFGYAKRYLISPTPNKAKMSTWEIIKGWFRENHLIYRAFKIFWIEYNKRNK